MRRIFPLVAVALLAAGSAAAQTPSRTTPSLELGSRERVLLLNTTAQRLGAVERSRALQVGAGAPAGLGSTERRNALRAVDAAGSSRRGATQEPLGAVERTTLLRRGPAHLQAALQRPATRAPAASGRVLAHRLRRRG